MIQKEFFPNKTALITLIAACLVVIISLGIRQTFGLFFFDFEIDLGCTQTEFGFAMGIQLLFWGLLGPVFGIITDKYGGRIAVILGFLFLIPRFYMEHLQIFQTTLDADWRYDIWAVMWFWMTQSMARVRSWLLLTATTIRCPTET